MAEFKSKIFEFEAKCLAAGRLGEPFSTGSQSEPIPVSLLNSLLILNTESSNLEMVFLVVNGDCRSSLSNTTSCCPRAVPLIVRPRMWFLARPALSDLVCAGAVNLAKSSLLFGFSLSLFT